MIFKTQQTAGGVDSGKPAVNVLHTQKKPPGQWGRPPGARCRQSSRPARSPRRPRIELRLHRDRLPVVRGMNQPPQKQAKGAKT